MITNVRLYLVRDTTTDQRYRYLHHTRSIHPVDDRVITRRTYPQTVVVIERDDGTQLRRATPFVHLQDACSWMSILKETYRDYLD